MGTDDVIETGYSDLFTSRTNVDIDYVTTRLKHFLNKAIFMVPIIFNSHVFIILNLY